MPMIAIGKKRGPSMPPPGGDKKPGLAVVISAGPKAGDTPKPTEDEPGEPGEKKASPDRAIVIRSNEHCKDCSNYDPGTGECEEVEGVFDPEDACHAYYEPMGGDGSGGEEMGEMPEGTEAPESMR